MAAWMAADASGRTDENKAVDELDIELGVRTVKALAVAVRKRAAKAKDFMVE